MPSDFAPFRRDPVLITVAGTQVALPYRSAAEWVAGVERLHVLASLLATPEQREVLADLVLAHPRAREDLRTESLRILAEATGRRWWEAGRLISTSASTEVLGRLVLAGVDPWQRTLGEWTAATYALCVKGADAKARLKLDFSLAVPPPGEEDAWDDENDPEETEAAVRAMMGM